jgi:uncharacterized protein (DUF4415 family)
MPRNKRELGSDLAKLDETTDEDIARQIAEDPDTPPEITNEELDRAEIWHGDKFIRRVGGRPKGSGTKELVTLRLDQKILEHFRAGGPGWQTRLNDTLRAAVETRPTADRYVRSGTTTGTDRSISGRVLSKAGAVLSTTNRALGETGTPARGPKKRA